MTEHMNMTENMFQSYFICRLFIFFQQKLHQSTSMYNDDGNDNGVGLKGCSGRGDSFNYAVTRASM